MRRLAIWAVIAFAAFYLFTEPENAAAAVGGAFSRAGDGADSVATFLTALFK